jgi:hypothetical protein
MFIGFDSVGFASLTGFDRSSRSGLPQQIADRNAETRDRTSPEPGPGGWWPRSVICDAPARFSA